MPLYNYTLKPIQAHDHFTTTTYSVDHMTPTMSCDVIVKLLVFIISIIMGSDLNSSAVTITQEIGKLINICCLSIHLNLFITFSWPAN